MDGGSAEPSLAEIHQEMSELLDKQVNAQKEKIFRGSRKLPQKCAMKMKVRRIIRNKLMFYTIQKPGVLLQVKPVNLLSLNVL